MKALIIGASGFLGNALVRSFAADGHEVWGTFRTASQGVPTGCRPFHIDDLASLPAKPDVVVIAAGNHAQSPVQQWDTNAALPRQMIGAFPNARIVYVSSVSVYGNPTQVVTEESSLAPISLYGWSKIAGEAVIRTHVSYAIVRPTYLYGSGMPTNSFIPAIIASAKSNGQITLFGDGSRIQDYLHVDDAASLCLAVSKYESNGTFLAVSGESVSNKAVADAICARVEGSSIIYQGEDTATSFRYDASWTTATLDWRSQHSLLTSVQEII